MKFAVWFTEALEDGTVMIHNYKTQWVAGRTIKNPLKDRQFGPLDKISKRLGYKPGENLLYGVERLEVVECGPQESVMNNGDGWLQDCVHDIVVVRLLPNEPRSL